MTARRLPVVLGACAVFLTAESAFADKVALVASRGIAADDPSVVTGLDLDLTRALAALGHTVIPKTEVDAAVKQTVQDGVPDTPEEYGAVAVATKADWVVAATIQPAVVSSRVEITAYLLSLRRVEVVAREVDKAHAGDQEKEMLSVLVRPEGIGTGELPWEKQPVKVVPITPNQNVVVQAPQKPPEPPPEPAKKLVTMDYVWDTYDIWPSYSANRRVFIAVNQGFALAAVRPAPATGSGSSIIGALRGGYTVGDLGLELLADFGGNLFGPPALFVDGGARWMLTPSLHRMGDHYAAGSWFMGPEIVAGAFVRLPGPDVKIPDGRTFTGTTSASFMVGGSLDMVFAATPTFSLEASMGNLRFIPLSQGTLLLLGASLGASARF